MWMVDLSEFAMPYLLAYVKEKIQVEEDTLAKIQKAESGVDGNLATVGTTKRRSRRIEELAAERQMEEGRGFRVGPLRTFAGRVAY
jgi:hypothetical protein